MAEIEFPDLRKRCEERIAGLARHRRPHEAVWRDISDFMQVGRSRWLAGSGWNVGQPYWMGGEERPQNGKILDNGGVRAAEIYGNGMSSGLLSASRVWLKFTTPDTDLAQQANVKTFLNHATQQIYRFCRRTNFYSQTKAGYQQLGLFGVEAGIITQHPIKGMVTQALEAGEYWLGLGDDLEPDTLYRACPMTVAQVVSRFRPPYGTGKWSRRVQQAYDRGSLDEVVPIIHAIEPNPERIPGRTDRTNKRWRSVYWECGEDRLTDGAGVLEFGGFDVKPFWAARANPMGTRIYSWGSGHSALGDNKQVQLQQLRKSQGIDFQVSPPMRAPVQMETRHIAYVPRGITYSNAADKDAWGPLFQSNINLSDLREDISETKERVKDAFHVPLFLAILDSEREMTAFEANLRNQEKYAQLGPVVEANMNEKLNPIVDIIYDILERTGQLEPAPEELRGHSADPEYVSALAQLQRAGEVNAIAQTVQFAGSLAPLQPDILDGIDLDKTLQRFGELSGIDSDLQRSDQDVAALRNARQQQQRVQQLQALAPAAKDGAQAAQAISQIDPSKLVGMTGAPA